MFADRTQLATNGMRTLLAAVGMVLCLGGCRTTDGIEMPELARDGLKCGSANVAGAVYLEVGYDASGTPTVDPAICEVDRGTRVTWRGPEDERTAFTVRFKNASPVENDPRGVLESSDAGARQRIRRELDGAPGRYDYAVVANGRELDPAIIIR